jgi:hypothetical protein
MEHCHAMNTNMGRNIPSASDVPIANHADGDAEARRAKRAKLLDSLQQKTLEHKHQSKRTSFEAALSIKNKEARRRAFEQYLDESSSDVLSSLASSTMLTHLQAKLQKQAPKRSESGYTEMSPNAFKMAYRPLPPLREVEVNALKSPASALPSPFVADSDGGGNKDEQSNDDGLIASPSNLFGGNDAEEEEVAEEVDMGGTVDPIPSTKKSATKKKSGVPSAALLRELRRAAAFYAQTFVFTEYERTSSDNREVLISEQFFGTPSNTTAGLCDDGAIKGTLTQLVCGDGAFARLYDEGDVVGDKKELILRQLVCGNERASRYVAGVDFTMESISIFSDVRQVTGRQLWDAAKQVMLNLKKAISLVKRLEGIIIEIDNASNRVLGYMSGKNEESFFRAILDGMWQIDKLQKAKKAAKKSGK